MERDGAGRWADDWGGADLGGEGMGCWEVVASWGWLWVFACVGGGGALPIVLVSDGGGVGGECLAVCTARWSYVDIVCETDGAWWEGRVSWSERASGGG